ncbi:helix-turn-helix domain-containing protein [Sporolactobacillus shoreicorticis]|uniref:Helix-turn-helix domain-containing protein n=1 Tax=Sporolactobacillus shoreicorticis TaxID=1923877 RepID=A0ABW5S8C2_9BACL|nr:helix-turn-helix transcriptional regulator [Sporolactobacillus shoreicorticis]MCO7126018.1 helix-turn-helix domain-containing protein [Sporolactobacillus shoreicorticis]
MDYGKRLRDIRKAKGLSAKQIADEMGIKPPYISDLELGKKGMTINTLERICGVLDVSLVDFFQTDKKPTDFDILEAMDGLSEKKKQQLVQFLNGLTDKE